MLREYEFTLVAKADLAEADRSKVIGNYEEIMQRSGGQFLKRDDWGTKKLSYPIKKQFKGHYVFYYLASHPDNIAECERLMRIDENVLRYMVVKVSDSVDIEARKIELAKPVVTPQEER